MMDIKCPNCKAEIEAPEDMAGQVANCPSCQHKISIPKSAPQKKKAKTSWRDAPASEAQLKYLKAYNLCPDKPITKGEASDLLTKAENENLPKVELELEPNDYAKEKKEARREITRLKKQVSSPTLDNKIKKIEEKLALTMLSEGDRTDLTDELEELQYEKSELQEKLQDAIDELECIIENEKGDKEEAKDEKDDKEMRIYDALELFGQGGKYSSYLKKPTKKQIREVLESLDEQYPEWELRGDESILATLQANFPELVKKGSRKKNPGCLGVLVLAVFPALLIVFMLFLLLPF
jgi:DNA-directed RNA polymerase subunit RPC12/RpoP